MPEWNIITNDIFPVGKRVLKHQHVAKWLEQQFSVTRGSCFDWSSKINLIRIHQRLAEKMLRIKIVNSMQKFMGEKQLKSRHLIKGDVAKNNWNHLTAIQLDTKTPEKVLARTNTFFFECLPYQREIFKEQSYLKYWSLCLFVERILSVEPMILFVWCVWRDIMPAKI